MLGCAGARLCRAPTPLCSAGAEAQAAQRVRYRARCGRARVTTARRAGDAIRVSFEGPAADQLSSQVCSRGIADGGALAQQVAQPHRARLWTERDRRRRRTAQSARHCAYERFTPQGRSRCCPSSDGYALIWTVPSPKRGPPARTADAGVRRMRCKRLFGDRRRRASSRRSTRRVSADAAFCATIACSARTCCSAMRRRRCIRSPVRVSIWACATPGSSPQSRRSVDNATPGSRQSARVIDRSRRSDRSWADRCLPICWCAFSLTTISPLRMAARVLDLPCSTSAAGEACLRCSA